MMEDILEITHLSSWADFVMGCTFLRTIPGPTLDKIFLEFAIEKLHNIFSKNR